MYSRQIKKAVLNTWLSAWPVGRPRNWAALVNHKMQESDAKLMRHSISRGTPLGADRWKNRISGILGLNTTLRPRGRPPKDEIKST